MSKTGHQKLKEKGKKSILSLFNFIYILSTYDEVLSL